MKRVLNSVIELLSQFDHFRSDILYEVVDGTETFQWDEEMCGLISRVLKRSVTKETKVKLEQAWT
jgi:hypothetical protein